MNHILSLCEECVKWTRGFSPPLFGPVPKGKFTSRSQARRASAVETTRTARVIPPAESAPDAPSQHTGPPGKLSQRFPSPAYGRIRYVADRTRCRVAHYVGDTCPLY